MRKALLIFIFLLLSVTAQAQSSFLFGPADYNNVWKVSGDAQYGVGNIYCTITRGMSPNEYGNYIYNIYFSTNSYFNNGRNARTYVQDIDISYYEQSLKIYLYPANFYRFWITIGQPSIIYTIYNPDPTLYIRVMTGIMQPTTY